MKPGIKTNNPVSRVISFLSPADERTRLVALCESEHSKLLMQYKLHKVLMLLKFNFVSKNKFLCYLLHLIRRRFQSIHFCTNMRSSGHHSRRKHRADSGGEYKNLQLKRKRHQ